MNNRRVICSRDTEEDTLPPSPEPIISWRTIVTGNGRRFLHGNERRKERRREIVGVRKTKTFQNEGRGQGNRRIRKRNTEFIVAGIFTADRYEYSVGFILRARRFLMFWLVYTPLPGQGLMKLGEKNANKSGKRALS